jgi:8-hydroxy-5-deazaflavin:NADPH oxidoreductase
MSRVTTIGIIGSGHVGSNLARAAIAHGYDVVLSNSQGPGSLAGLVSELGPKARAATPAQAGAAGDFAIVAIPLTTIDQVPVEPLAGKVVIATINYFPQRFGHVPEIDNGTTTAPGLLQAHLPAGRVVRAFSMINAAEMSGDGRSAGRSRWPETTRPLSNWWSACTTSSASTRWTSAAWTRAGGLRPDSPRSSPARTSPS